MIKNALKRNWGFTLFTAVSLVALARLLLQKFPGHYRVFTGAGHAIWSGLNPYGTDFGTGVGYYFYSPSCALFFFGPLSALPEKLGLLLYMLLSWGVFVWGVKEFCRTVLNERELGTSPEVQGFWLMISPQIFGGILASKLEIIMTGLLLLSTSWLLDSVRGGYAKLTRSAVVLAMILNWKFQPLPSVGLLALVWILSRKDWKWPATLAASLAGWYALPFAFRSPALLLEAHQVWSKTFSAFVAESWLNFENLFSFLNNALGVYLSFQASQIFTLVVAALLGIAVLAWTLRNQKTLDEATLLRKGAVLALALGSMFTAVFSPLGQNNALILYSPLLLAGFLSLREAQGTWRRAWMITLPLVWAAMTLPYSDFLPKALRENFRHLVLKPPTCLALAMLLLAYAFGGAENRQKALADQAAQ